MKWSIQQLHKYTHNPLEFSYSQSFDEYSQNVRDIIRMDEVLISGKVTYIGNDSFRFEINIKTTLYLYESRTLDEIDFPIDLNVEEVLSKNPTEDEVLIPLNTVDLTDVIWENILLEIPMRIVRSE